MKEWFEWCEDCDAPVTVDLNRIPFCKCEEKQQRFRVVSKWMTSEDAWSIAELAGDVSRSGRWRVEERSKSYEA